SGLDILRALKEKYPKIKVLVITGMNKQSLNKEIIESGAKDILYKPFDMEDLTLALKKLAK
ncbi:MAG: response regulator, partial [Elusimicrobiaceae bacterium]|nr:response regulator [Elusimicrobiaceae bacterium]